MATLDTLNVVIGAQIDDFEAKMAQVQSGIGRLSDIAKQAGQSLTTFVTLPLGLLAGASIKAAGDIQALEKGFAATYKGSEDLSVALAKVRDLAKLPGLGLQEALQGATNLQAAGFSANLATRALGAFGNALATVGKGRADLDGVGLALSQIASKGKISAEEINQLAERVPQIRKVMQDAFGTADAQALQKLGIGATEFVEKVTTELEKLPKVTGGINNAFENLADAGTIALSKLGNSLNNAFDIEGVLGRLADFIGEAVASFERLDPATQKTIFIFAGVAAAVGPVLVAIGALGAALPALAAGFTLLAGPVGLAVAALAGAALLIVRHWDELVSYFTTGEGARVFADLAAAVQDAGSTIAEVFAQLSKTGSGSFGELLAAIRPVQNIIRELGDGITGLLDTFSGTVKGITALVNGDFKGALAGGGQAVDGLTRPIRSLFGLLEERSADFSEFFGLIPAPAEAAAEAIEKVVKAVGGLSADQLKALADLEKKLLDNRNASRALGDSYDYSGNKAKILEAGIVSLTDVGFAPGGKAVQNYVAQLRAVPEAIDQIQARVLKGSEHLFDAPDFKLQLPDLSQDTMVLPDYNGIFRGAAQNVIDGTGLFQGAFTQFTQQQADFNTNTAALLDAFPSQGFTAIGQGIGAALGAGSDVLEGAGKALLKVLADFGTKYGEQLILLGVADIATGLFVSKGIAEIAAGTALVAGSAALGALAGGGGGSAGGGSSLASQPSSAVGGASAGNQQAIKVVAEFVLRGKDLVAVARVQDYRSSRTG